MILYLDCVPMKPNQETGLMDVAQTPDEFLVVLRQHRNVMLSQTDWRVMSDSPLTQEEQQEWVSYRNYLRQLTDNVEMPLSNTLTIVDPPASGGPLRVAIPGELNR